MAIVTTTTAKKTKKPPVGLLVVLGILVLAVVVFIHAGPKRHDMVTETDLSYIRTQIGNYAVANKTMPTMEQLNLPTDMQKRAAERHYTLTPVADHSNRNTFFQEATFDYKQCADFLTSTSDLPGDTNDTHHGYHLHHKGTHCFINYATLKGNAFRP